MRYKTKRRLSLLVLVLGIPAYIIVAVNLIDLFERPSFWVELLVYLGLGILWIIPLKPIFLGVGQPDPDDKKD
ncbi:DUF2842 domain-containing protein [Stagnihabitans tardus]|uniref:DUF2842 domain-containing protein n=1 Tax=Stagnihabitans tardus TaxID=2699202 RepID=A0AAE5BX18_9RHOB|nr:DUF2842 domain-containing protein [Stagnihabitans tardus]NBZ89449.1 DUF2842 domain-containing protein [Stagnihabitans tardus]